MNPQMIWNPFDGLTVDGKSFAYRDMLGQDRWIDFTPVFGALTVVGDTTYVGRLRIIGRKCEFQVRFSAATSIASAAGTDYLTLPVAATGLSGMATMTNDTTNIAVGVCHIDTATSRCYLPAQVASANLFTLAGWYEI